jgi:hypothetical protein
MHIDKAGCHIQAACLNCAGASSVNIANCHDAITADTYIADNARITASVKDRAAADQEIVIEWLRFTTTAN